HLRSIYIGSSLLAPYNGAIIPRVPEPAYHIDKLVGDLVALVVLVMALLAEVERSIVRATSDDVPCDATLAQVLQRLEGARDRKGLAEARRHRGAEANMTRRDTQSRNSCCWFEARLERGMVARSGRKTVGDEEKVEFSPLGNPCASLHDLPIAIAIGCALHPPSRGVIAGAEPEHRQMHVAPLGSHAPFS